MILKYGSLFVCLGTSFSYGSWKFCNVTLSEDSLLKIETCGNTAEESTSREFHLSPEWFIINPRPSSAPNCPPLPENKKQDGLFALTQPSESSIWFLTSSKYEKNLHTTKCKTIEIDVKSKQDHKSRSNAPSISHYRKHMWIEKILPIITLKPPTPPEPPPPYSEYDNLSYFPWDASANAGTVGSKSQNSFTLPRPSIHNRSGFYSLEKPIKKPPKPVEPLPKPPEAPPPPLPLPVRDQSDDSFHCVNCCALGCACICETLTMCLHMCCTNFGAAF